MLKVTFGYAGKMVHQENLSKKIVFTFHIATLQCNMKRLLCTILYFCLYLFCVFIKTEMIADNTTKMLADFTNKQLVSLNNYLDSMFNYISIKGEQMKFTACMYAS